MKSRNGLIRWYRIDVFQNTGEMITPGAADADLDQMGAAFVEKFEGAGAEYAVTENPHYAEYLAYSPKGWTEKDAAALRAVIEADTKQGEAIRATLAEGRAMVRDNKIVMRNKQWVVRSVSDIEAARAKAAAAKVKATTAKATKKAKAATKREDGDYGTPDEATSLNPVAA